MRRRESGSSAIQIQRDKAMMELQPGLKGGCGESSMSRCRYRYQGTCSQAHHCTSDSLCRAQAGYLRPLAGGSAVLALYQPLQWGYLAGKGGVAGAQQGGVQGALRGCPAR